MAHPAESAASIIVLVVGIVTTILMVLALKARQRTGNRRLPFVAGAFGAFSVKSFLTAWALQTGSIAHEHLELVSSGFDLVIVVLLTIPFLR
jgi:hypothetical protein